MKSTTLILAAILIFSLLGCGGGGSQSIFDDSTCANSSQGGVPTSSRAYAPGGASYVQQASPVGTGKLNIYTKNGVLEHEINLGFPSLHTNDLKGMAWSRDGKYIVVMYHGGLAEEGFTLIDALTGTVKGKIGVTAEQWRYYHYIVFSSDNQFICLSVDGTSIVKIPFDPNSIH